MRKYIFLTIITLFSFILISCKKTIKVAFDYEFGTKRIDSKIDISKKYIPTKDGHDFDFWYVDSKLTTKYDFIEHNKLSEINLYANFSINIDSEETQRSLVELYKTALKAHEDSNTFEVLTTGTIITDYEMVGNQSIYTLKQHKNNQYYQYTATYGKMKELQKYQELFGSKEELVSKEGSTNSDLSPNKKNSESTISLESNKVSNGININEINHRFNYEDVISISNFKMDNGTKSFRIKLANEAINPNYSKHIKTTNPYETKSLNFNQVLLDIEIDSENKFKEISYYEEYTIEVIIKLGFNLKVKQKITSIMKDTFNYNGKEITINKYNI